MDTHLSHGLRCAIGQIRTSSHQLEIEFGRFRGIPPESRICKWQITDREKQERKEKQEANNQHRGLPTLIPKAPSLTERLSLGNRDDHDRDAEAHFTGGDYSKGLEAF